MNSDQKIKNLKVGNSDDFDRNMYLHNKENLFISSDESIILVDVKNKIGNFFRWLINLIKIIFVLRSR